ncbi:large subunit of N,N-dimethylformamidase [Microbacterium pseudoresistens]|uniref:N,N-dimethylformamidase n=1 Tax=Microbacterium pseudoresistens TaxID=640634 RepID=A0A7Y9ESS6_9MICO|nr:N,N-dimethylformamidase beta subunit family domain-containing protein [Microbacterium pseudoresistens]NYD53308.1 N,N-dimethylformamidase [Microbacterium pseudoresistens]
MTLTGYLNTLSAEPGEAVDLMMSASADLVEVDLVRLQHGDDNPAGPGRKILPVPEFIAQTVRGGLRDVHLGSCVVVPSVGTQSVEGLSLSVLMQPTTPSSGREQGVLTLLAANGATVLGIVVDAAGRLGLRGADEARLADLTIAWRRGSWYRVQLEVPAGGPLVLRCAESRGLGEEVALEIEAQPLPAGSIVSSAVIAAASCRLDGRQWVPDRVFNGKIERPEIHRVAAEGSRIPVAEWRFELEPGSAVAVDVSGHERHGIVVGSPARASTGHSWRHEEVDFRKAPEQYGAIHFHDDDLDDAGWEPSLRFTVPEDLTSGVYAVELRAGDVIDHVPFVVRPRDGEARARTVVLLPTFTYLAYGNERMVTRLDFEGDQMSDHAIRPGHRDLELAEHPEWGLSLYDVHSDGSTCAYATHLRPIPNLRPDYRAWLQNAPRHLSADLYLIDWLTEKGYSFDVVTDHDLHRDGAALLAEYDVVLTGSHPEYVSARMLDALDAHVHSGGSMMYLGGNGFYWVTSQDSARPHIIEVRRGPVGTRPSEGAPGEGHHSTTGEPGGMWRQRGRWPNHLTGIGMTAQGWDSRAPGYRRNPDLPEECAFVFDGVDEEVIGTFGLIMDGSSGDEIDRFDVDRGSPAETVVLASSTGHSDFYFLAGEDVMASRAGLGGTQSPEVRSDMTWLEKPGGGAVFSVGSICFLGSLSHNGYRNNISTVVANALDEMLRRPSRQR